MLTIKSIPKSTYIKGIEWASERIPYHEDFIKGDTYPITWGADDMLYTSSGDPNWGTTHDGLDVERFEGMPDDLKISKVNDMDDFLGWGGAGPKPTGMISIDGVLYLAIQNVCKTQIPPFNVNSQHGSDATILTSFDNGYSCAPPFKSIKEPMFPGYKFGGPAFINFGKDNENAPDDYVYAVSADQWDNGSNLRLGRVPKKSIVDRAAWQWVQAFDADGNAVFGYSLDNAIPILSIHGCISAPEMVYIKQLDRYILFSWRLHENFSPEDGTDLFIMESPTPWGPFSLVHVEEYWEGKEFNPYCPRLPLKWMSEDGKEGCLLFSGSWGPRGQEELLYRANMRKFRFIME